MIRKIEALEALARDMVGDGKSPNVYFVTDGGTVTTITRDKDVARRAWEALAARRPLQESMLEDRLTGVLADVGPRSDEPGAPLFVNA